MGSYRTSRIIRVRSRSQGCRAGHDRLRADEALGIGLVNRVVAAPTLEAGAAAWAAEIAKSPREGLTAAKRIVADLRAGRRGGEPEAYGAGLRTSPAARERIRAFVGREKTPERT